MLQEAVEEYIASLSSYEDERGRSNQNTTAAYRNDLGQLCTYLSQHDIENWPQVTREHIAGYLLEMREGQAYRPTTIARKIAALKSFFRYMRSMGYIALDPVEKLEAPRIQKELPGVLSAEQISSLFRQVEVETPAGLRDLAMLHMLYATGMRVTELVSLNMGDFDAQQATVVCPGRNGRNKRERVLPLPPIAVEATQHYIEKARPRLMQHHPDELALFLNHHGERLTRQGYWLIIKGYARQADITNITPHMLRHSFAMLMLKGGMELRSVQERLGHAHISTTQVYSQLARAKRTTPIT
ncbi:MAG TPA: tyrosine-type recombinase/integrase [Ktedonobacteraceae bacterium]|nr:tyrosine-type recombinase/integrase [Ktedonobacteraceae bacterium]